VALLEGLLRRGALTACDGYFLLSAQGRADLAALGIALPPVTQRHTARRFAYPCLDWSERRDHLAGGLAVLLLDHFVASSWLRRVEGSRALRLTPEGSRRLAPWIAEAQMSATHGVGERRVAVRTPGTVAARAQGTRGAAPAA
jgi:hypothetical protein